MSEANHSSFADLFSGSDKAFGKCIPKEETSERGKRSAKYWYEKRPVNLSDWEAHFSGQYQIGMPPIRSDNKVRWGAIDVDMYGLDMAETQLQIEKLKLPLVLCRSKSGGLHMFLFLQDWIPASDMIKIMDAVAAQLGFGSSEIFPKQARIVEGESDFGNFINLPYFNEGQDGQVAIAPDGTEIKTVAEFVAYAQMRRMRPEDLRAVKVEDNFNTILPDGPPCLNILYEAPVHDGIRNTLLCNTAVYLKKVYPDSKEWEEQLHNYNARLKPPLERSEVDNIIKSYNKKDYYFQCSESCMKKFCNSSLCRTRKFGVGEGSFLSNNRSLTKLNAEPPLWFLDVKLADSDPVRICLQTDELMNQSNFQKRCMEALSILPSTVKIPVWENQIQQLLAHATIIDLPDDSSIKDQFYDLLEQFLGTRASKSEEHDLFRGLPYQSATHYCFKREDLERFLEQKRFKENRSNRIVHFIMEVGAEAQNRRLAGRRTRFWQLGVGWNGSEQIQFSTDRKAEPF